MTSELNPVPLRCRSLSCRTRSPQQLLLCFLCWEICLFWLFLINGVIGYIVFAALLLSFNLTF